YDLRFVREYLIQNVEAQEVVDAINQLGLASVSAAASSTTSAASRRTTAAPVRPGQPRTPTSTAKTAGADQPYISIRAASNSLLVNGTAEQHKVMELVIAYVDVVQKDQRTIRQYEIQYVDTQEIIDTLTDLGIIVPQSTSAYGSSGRSRSTDPRSRSAAARTAQPGQPNAAEGAALSLPTAEGGSEKDITAEQPQISVLETTNSLLVYATPRQHDAIALVIGHADRTPDVVSTPYVVYALENQDPIELAEVLTKLIQETVEEVSKTSTPTSKIQSRPGTTTAAKLPTLEEQNIRVIPDEMSYSLIVYANKRNQQWIAELISELDEYRPQVLLDCTLVDINKNDAFNYSIDLIAKTYGGSSIQDGSPVGKAEGVPLYGDFSERTLSDIQSTGGTVTGFFNSEMIQGVLEAVQTNGYGRVMAQPKILVNDNQEGEIRTENETSIAQQSSQTIPGTGTSAAIVTEDVTFVPYSEGVILTIKPHISKGDMLRLEISLSRTDFTERNDVTVAGKTYPRPPDLLTTDVKTVATVPDGTTIILGGLEAVDQNKSQDKIPLLGDLPLIGTLFRGVNNTDKENRLYVFVKANIIRPGDQIEGLEDIRRVSKKYRDKFEKMEEKFQGLQDFPGIKPKPMSPVKVLEEDDFDIASVAESGVVVSDDNTVSDGVVDSAAAEDPYLEVVRRKLRERERAAAAGSEIIVVDELSSEQMKSE
ncbi:MAG: type II secretion system protein GspD, partial [Planctomycetota bacterium]